MPSRPATDDLIVVGAGPAGSTLAARVARQGFRVRLIEKRRVVGFPVHCGEGIAADTIIDAGFTLHEPWLIRPVAGCRIVMPNSTTILFPRPGYLIDRQRFDAALAARAVASGAQLALNELVAAVHPEADGWLVETSRTVYRTRLLAGADGVRSVVARALGYVQPWSTAWQYKFAPRGAPRDAFLHFHHDAAYYPGYAWVFERGHETSIGLGMCSDVVRKLNAFCVRRGYDPAQRRSSHRGLIPANPVPGPLRRGRAFLVGDAAGFSHPFTRGGVCGAVFSARAAAAAAVEALRHDDPGYLAAYDRAVRPFPSRQRGQLLLPRCLRYLDNQMIGTLGSFLDRRPYRALPVGHALRVLAADPNPKSALAMALGFAIRQTYRASEPFAW